MEKIEQLANCHRALCSFWLFFSSQRKHSYSYIDSNSVSVCSLLPPAMLYYWLVSTQLSEWVDVLVKLHEPWKQAIEWEQDTLGKGLSFIRYQSVHEGRRHQKASFLNRSVRYGSRFLIDSFWNVLIPECGEEKQMWEGNERGRTIKEGVWLKCELKWIHGHSGNNGHLLASGAAEMAY